MAKFMSFSKIAIKNLFSKPATSAYPFVPKEYPERTRGHVEIEKDNCILCGMCMRSCPPGAIKVDRAGCTWSISGFDCVQCGYCVDKCPKKCLSIVPGYTAPAPEKSTRTVQVPEPPKPAPKPPVAKPAASNAVAKADATNEAAKVAAKTDAENATVKNQEAAKAADNK